MKRGTRKERRRAIESGVSNAVDTVCIDQAITADEAWEQLDRYISDGLNCHGLDDTCYPADLAYGKTCFPL